MDTEKLSDRYSPQDVEKKIYQWWEDGRYFASEDASTKKPFSVILPPPNVTGHLHLGHALDHTIQDVVVRWKRMSGFNTLWLPGSVLVSLKVARFLRYKLWLRGNDYFFSCRRSSKELF